MNNEIKFYSKQELAQQGITCAQIVRQVVEIDSTNGLNEENTENFKRLTAVFEATDNMWRVLMCGGRVIGYWNCVVLNDEYQKQIESGHLHEGDIRAENLQTNLLGKKNNLLFDSVCIDKPYRRAEAFKMMICSVYETLSRLPAGGVQIDNVFASVWTGDGKAIVGNLGFNFQNKNAVNGQIYSMPFDTMMQRMKATYTRLMGPRAKALN